MRSFELGEIIFFSLFVLVPALFVTAFPPKVRWVLFVVGVGLGLALEFLTTPSGPDNPAILLPLLGFGLAAGVLLLEMVAFPLRLMRRRREAERPGDLGRFS